VYGVGLLCTLCVGLRNAVGDKFYSWAVCVLSPKQCAQAISNKIPTGATQMLAAASQLTE